MIKKVLISGHRGYIGSRLKKELEKNPDYVVMGVDLKDGDNLLTSDLPYADIVFHLAAQSGAIPSMKNPLWDAETNILGTIRIAKEYTKAKIIYATSGGALDPESPYGLSKKTGEEYLKLLHENTVICRLSSIYGEKDRGVVDNFIREDEPTIFGSGEAMRDFVHVDDIVKGLVKAIEWDKGEYSMGSAIPTSVLDIAEATGKNIVFKNAREGEKMFAVLSNTTPNWDVKIEVLDYVKRNCGK